MRDHKAFMFLKLLENFFRLVLYVTKSINNLSICYSPLSASNLCFEMTFPKSTPRALNKFLYHVKRHQKHYLSLFVNLILSNGIEELSPITHHHKGQKCRKCTQKSKCSRLAALQQNTTNMSGNNSYFSSKLLQWDTLFTHIEFPSFLQMPKPLRAQ